MIIGVILMVIIHEAGHFLAAKAFNMKATEAFFGFGPKLWSMRRGEEAGNDPWDAWTLEWSTTSPPPAYNFAVLPEVRSRRPLWDLKHPKDPDWRHE